MRHLLLVLALLASLTQPAAAQPIHAVRLGTTSISSPVFVTAPPGDTSRLFVVSEVGSIYIMNPTTGAVNPTAFLTIPNVSYAGENGLLGLAFHPDYANNGFFYVYYSINSPTYPNGRMIARFHVSPNPDVADPASATTIFFFPNAQGIHNGGWTAFGPDGYLYVAWGNHGTLTNSSDLTTPLGKILRFDINGPDGIPGTADDDQFPADPNRNFCIPPNNPFAGSATNEQAIWAYGLRNPWRDSFDRATGDLYIADVGDSTWEEVNYAPPPPAAAGRNYGYPCMEGAFCRGSTTVTNCACNNPSLTLPIYAYQHTLGCAIVGGYVYRGCAMPWLNGQYFFTDNCSGRVWSGRYDGSALAEVIDHSMEVWGAATHSGVNSMGEDARGELYICAGNAVYKLVPATLPDCNNNGIADGCDIATGASRDLNHDSIPDECQGFPCDADFNHDGDAGTDADIETFFACLAGNCCPTCGSADFNADGDSGTDSDIEAFFRVLAGGTC